MDASISFKLDHDHVTWQPDQPVERVEGASPPVLAQPAARLAEKLRHPDAGPSFREFLAAAQAADIVVSDHTRQVGYREFLPALLDTLNASGIQDDDLELIVAVGLHDPEAAAVTRATLGDAIFARVKVTQHRCKDASTLATVQPTSGPPVRVMAKLARVNPRPGFHAKLRPSALILTGSITFHYHAGFGGGRKAIFPGCASYDDVLANHKLLLDPAGPRGRNPNCQPGRTDGNPIYEQSVEVLKACKPAFLINTVMTNSGGIAEFFTGDPIEAHRIGSAYVEKNFTAEIHTPADLVIAGAGGAPKDGTLYQAHKAYDNAARAVRPGGAIVLVAGLGEGLGPAAFKHALAHATIDRHRAALFGDGYSIPSQTCLACREKAERARTWIVGPPAQLHDDLRRIGFTPAPDIAAAVAAARAHLGAGQNASQRTLVLPNAGQVLPIVNGKVAAL